MKKKDIALIVVIAVLAGITSLIIARVVFAKPAARAQKVEVVEAISTDFPAPDTRYFNVRSINPTQLIRITENSNQTPFNSTN